MVFFMIGRRQWSDMVGAVKTWCRLIIFRVNRSRDRSMNKSSLPSCGVPSGRMTPKGFRTIDDVSISRAWGDLK